MKKRVLFCGTPGFAVPSLKALIEDDDFDVPLVLTQPDRPSGRGQKLRPSPIKQFAAQSGLKVESPESVNTSAFIAELQAQDFDACVVVAFGQILKQCFLDLFPGRCVNVHGSLLPRWRGAAPIQRALMAGDKTSGVSLQQVVRQLDAGPVIGERDLQLGERMTAIELHDRLSEMGADLLINEFKSFLHEQITPQSQDESLVTYADKISKAEAVIDWRKSATEICNQVRGLAMGPQARFRLLGKHYKIHLASVYCGALLEQSQAPGEVLSCDVESGLVISCGDGALSVLQIQPESKQKLLIGDFVRGQTLPVGEYCYVSST